MPAHHPHPGATQHPDPVLSIERLIKHYRGRTAPANDGISLTARPGRVLGILGHNGAGKTTLVNQIVGLLKPSSGTIRVAGIDAVAHPARARELVSVQAQANVPITGLTPRTAIELVGRIRGGERGEVRRRASQLLEELDLGAWADTPAQKISGGVARLTAFCMAAVRPGALVILDEPTNDVDPARRRLLWDAIRATAEAGAGVLLVTHNVREAERAVDDLVVLDRGRVIGSGTPAQLTAHLRSQLFLELDGTALPRLPDDLEAVPTGPAVATAAIPTERAAEAVAWAQAAVSRGDIERFSLTPASLEDAYLELVGTDAGVAA
ncbi:ABC transporter ATP-binding protein [Leucobacter luti]|uniref:ABC-2 type transport system ATP-binding protein n=1 Tax=Leucobacter luti TaxID=340320 RepID=A0A4Q7U4T4_9MICO|nr:ABC transporter ATP-binding protein [Leucobacter luti]MBL3700465.1 ABC transporter ATP-binding protein [Leucobacter luti]RZT68701.1 ABC-2 type transport system ATP-binding protein [Leucobacter luti]